MNTTSKNEDRNGQSAAANVIQFRFDSHAVRTIADSHGEPWFCAKDVCTVLGYRNDTDAVKKHCREAGVAKRDLSSGGQMRELVFINEGNLYRLIIKSRKEEAQRFESWVCDEVLPAIRKHGSYTDTNNKMGTLIGETIGTNGFNMLGALIKGKVTSLPANVQRKATAKIWSQTHAAFGVRSAADIPASQLDAARNFIAAYALEGEWFPKDWGVQVEAVPLRRYLISFDHKGRQHVSLVPSDASVMSHQNLIEAMVNPGDLAVSTDEMFEFTMAALANLKRRSDFQDQKLRQQRVSGL